jgi:hypothetical protein
MFLFVLTGFLYVAPSSVYDVVYLCVDVMKVWCAVFCIYTVMWRGGGGGGERMYVILCKSLAVPQI